MTTKVTANHESPRHFDHMKSFDYGRLSKALFFSHGPPDWIRSIPIKLSDAAHSVQFQSRHTRAAVWPVHDLVFNDILLWVLPTHALTLMIKFSVVVVCLLTASLYAGFRSILMKEEFAKSWWWMVTAGVGFLSIGIWCFYYRRVLDLVFHGKTWMDPTIPAINRLAMHVPLRLFESEEAARRAACQPQLTALNDDPKKAPNVWRMDDLEWKFLLKDTAEEGLEFVQRQLPSAEEEWNRIPIPSNWTMQGFCKDKPIYTNMIYPFPCQPPVVPHKNATGIYRVNFDLPWETKPSMDDFTLLFHGVESACYVYLNHKFVGFSKDSRLPAEFDVTPYLQQSGNLLEVVVMRWSDGSYVEDQDHWWMAGIHRSVELIRRSAEADLLDYQVQADASGHLTCSVDLRPTANGKILQMKLFNDRQISGNGEEWEQRACILTKDCKIDVDQQPVTLSTDVDPSFLKLWTAETPHLYTITLSVLSEDKATPHQVESCRVGFRTVDIHDGAVHVNGRPITVCGMNRHEHCPDNGKVVSMERMMEDICILK